MIVYDKQRLLAQIQEQINSIDNSMISLMYSYEKCKNIGEKSAYNLEEQESFEALTARFSRTSDILTQKVLKTFYRLLQEDVRTIIDGANLLEKIEIIESADDLLNIRELRNQIAHEYVDTELPALFNDVLKYVPLLKEIIENLKANLKRA